MELQGQQFLRCRAVYSAFIVAEQTAFQVRSAVFPAFDGSQYASTYAGAALFGESLYFASHGTYEVSCFAASPTGSLFLSNFQPVTVQLQPGNFAFQINRQSLGQPVPMMPGTNWTRYSAQFEIPSPGNYEVGVANIIGGPYFIYYDRFSIKLLAVPEPTCAASSLFSVPLLYYGEQSARSSSPSLSLWPSAFYTRPALAVARVRAERFGAPRISWSLYSRRANPFCFDFTPDGGSDRAPAALKGMVSGGFIAPV